MFRHSLLVLSVLLASAMVHAGSESRDLSGFSDLEVTDGIELQIAQGAEHSIVVSSGRGRLSEIATELHGSELRIRRVSQASGSEPEVEYLVRVTLPNLRSLVAGDGSLVRGVGVMTGKEMRLSASSGADLNMNVSVERLQLNASGGANVAISGRSRLLYAELISGAKVGAQTLVAEEAKVLASSGCSMELKASGSLSVLAVRGSQVIYHGEPTSREIRRKSRSVVRRIDP